MSDDTFSRARSYANAVALESFFRGASRLGRLLPEARVALKSVAITRDVPYLPTGRVEHRLDVYRPKDAPKGAVLPAVLYIHGGAFQILSKDTHWVMACAFARWGAVVFNVSYRLAPANPFPAAVEDACDAYAWVAKNAARYGADAERLVVAGESAGANLTVSAALAATFERKEPHAAKVFATGIVPRAIVPACGIFQVTDCGRFERRKPHLHPFVAERLRAVERGYLGCGPFADNHKDLADPLCVLESDEVEARPLPPTFLPVGTKDPLLDDTRRLARALDRRGVENEARYYPGEVHAFHALTFRENARRCWADTFAFLDRHVERDASTPRTNALRSA